MNEKKLYKNKYRIKSIRLPNWDYGWNAAYFITICAKNRIHYFGKIENEKMILTDIGKSAEKYWYEIPEHFPFVKLGEFVVMPNHIHGIIIIDKPSRQPSQKSKNKFGPQSQNLASIVRGYKIGVTKYSKRLEIEFKWQSRFYEHIIRNENERIRIQDYINDNVKNWEEDGFYNDK